MSGTVVSDGQTEAGIAPVVATLRLSPAASLVLDIARFSAALAVVLGHLSMLTAGMHNYMPQATGAVGLFFVLSGFVIRYVTKYRASTLRGYLLDRASRLLSVTIPALCFTLIVDLIARHAAHDPITQPGDYIARYFSTFTFTSQVWFQDLAPRENGGFWSLSYEAFYYVMYGFGFYLTGWKRIALLGATCLLAGPSILFLAPVWFFGCFLQDCYQRIHRSRRKTVLAICAVLAAGVVAAVVLRTLPHGTVAAIRDAGRNFQDAMWQAHMQRASTWYWETGIPCGLALVCALLLLHRVAIPTQSRVVRSIRFIADGTFALYLFQGPLLGLVLVFIHYDPTSRLQVTAIFLAIVTIGILMERPCLMLKNYLRRRLER